MALRDLIISMGDVDQAELAQKINRLKREFWERYKPLIITNEIRQRMEDYVERRLRKYYLAYLNR